jgi:hypothetical protein
MGRGLSAQQPNIVNHLGDAGLFLFGRQQDGGNTDNGAD